MRGYVAVADLGATQLDAMAVAQVDDHPRGCLVTFEPAPPEKVLGKEGVSASSVVIVPRGEALTQIENARFDAWLEHGGPQPKELT